MDVVNACTDPRQWLAGWQGLALIALVISYLIVSLYYMIGKMISSPVVEAKAKNEFYQTFMTTIMAAFLVGMVPVLCAFNLRDVGIRMDGNLFYVAEFYVTWVVHKAMLVLSQVIDWNHIVSIASSLGMGRTVYGVSITNSPLSGFSALTNVVNILMSSTMIAVLVAFAQLVVLKFIYAGMFNILLPVGIICRSFSFTREFGGALIAIAVGFFLFYPLLLNVDYFIIGQPTEMPEDAADMSGAINVMDLSIDMLTSIGVKMLGELAGSIGPAAVVGAVAGMVTDIMVVIIVVNRVIEIYIELVTSGVAAIFISAFLLPALNGIVLVSTVRDLSRLLGTETDISTLTRMI